MTSIKIASLVAAVIIIVVMIFEARPATAPEPAQNRQATLNGQAIELLVARTAAERFRGLSDREQICEQCGMIFLFEESAPRTFVMRQMRFALDIVWVSQGRVIGIDRNLPPDNSEPLTPYTSGEPADTVLELPAGGADRYGLIVGGEFRLE